MERAQQLGSSPFLKVLNTSYPLLRIADHLPKQIRKASLAELLCSTAIQRPVVDCFTVGGVAES
jgi:hypothetical protein